MRNKSKQIISVQGKRGLYIITPRIIVCTQFHNMLIKTMDELRQQQNNSEVEVFLFVLSRRVGATLPRAPP